MAGSSASSQGIAPIGGSDIDTITNQNRLGKHVFRFDYKTTIYTKAGSDIVDATPAGQTYNLPNGSYQTLKFSKGDIVDVFSLGTKTSGNSSVIDPSKKMIKVPSYVKPIGGTGFSDFITIDNSGGWLKKVDNSTPLTTNLGVDFGKNIKPVKKPVEQNTTPTTPTPETQTTTTDSDSKEVKGFFDDRNNLLIVAGVIVLGYLLLKD